MLKAIDKMLNHVTMYKLLFYYLLTLLGVGFIYSAVGILHYNALYLAASTILILVTCLITNKVFANIFNAQTNVESVYITAFILALIIAPFSSLQKDSIMFLLAASGLAIASKYILTINKKHIFNPAAIAVALTALGPKQSASWWVGTTALLPFVIIGGILLVRKIRRGRMVSIFFGSSLMATVLYSWAKHQSIYASLHTTLLSSAMFFLGFVMLTEPLTSPTTKGKRSIYAALVGFLFPPQFHILSFYSTPELALVAGNVFSYIVSPKTRLFPVLKQKERITPDSLDFVFETGRNKFNYQPGQYMDWTLAHDGTDARGSRRYFTLASSPTEKEIRIGVKFYQPSSSYKKALLNLDDRSPIVADTLGGDFVMPKDINEKLVFIAGGIGVTPFRSMAKYLIDKKESRSITMLYSAKSVNDLAYKKVFEQARKEVGFNTIYIVTGQASAVNHPYLRQGRISAEMIKTEVPDFNERTFYISGTDSMINSVKKSLRSLGVPRSQIKEDYFAGYS